MNMEIVDVKIEELKEASYNPRRMTEKQAQGLRDSISEFGLVDPIIVNSHPDRYNIVIGGHQRLNIAKEMGFAVVPVHYVPLELERERELNLRLNKNTGEWDLDMLANFDMEDLERVGFNSNDLNLNIDKFDDYSKKIVTPIYEPKNEKPMVNELYNKEKADKLLDLIESSDLSYLEKDFLKYCAYRFTVFNYSKIADYYAHSDDNMKDIMEKLALVIIDYDKAVENGFVKVSNELFDLQEKE
jgi:hypothetical protein